MAAEETSVLDISDMDNELEVQHEETGKNYWAVILLVLCIFVVFGNVLVILSVARERLLQNMTNFFIVSLALADLLVAGFVMPFSVYVLVSPIYGLLDQGHKSTLAVPYLYFMALPVKSNLTKLYLT